MDKDKVIDYVMSTPYNTNRQVLEGMLDEYGKGSEGSGDWSTAEVTFIGKGNGTVTIPHIEQVPEEQAELFPTNTVLMTTGHLDEETTTFQVPLYKGCYVFESSNKFTVSGNITQLNTRMAIITGNCTITLGTFN